ALEQAWRDAGSLPGLNLGIELRFPLSWVDPRRDELLGELAAEMAGKGFDVIVAVWNPAITALRRTGANTPVVMVGAIDPVGNGFVRSTSRPGSNMTGLMPSSKEHVERGGLVSYGADARALFRRAATYVSSILNGANPADLPVERPGAFELAVNISTAKTLGLTIPSSLLQWADQVIE